MFDTDDTDDLFADTEGAEGIEDDLVEVEDEVTGEIDLVTPEEAKRMGLRQQDYTRKTQALSEREKRISGLEAILQISDYNPVAAVQTFQDMLLAEGKLRLAEPDDEDDERHPLERQLAHQQALIEQMQNDARADKFEASMISAIAKHDLNIDLDDLFQFMTEADIGNPDTAARYLALEARGSAKTEAQSSAIAAKRSLPPVHTGTGRAAPVASGSEVMSMADAYALAVKQHSR